jgi:hypothetical protein
MKRVPNLVTFSWIATLAAWLAASSAAHGVIISAGDGQGNTALPAGIPVAKNVAHLSSASAVYLGNRWFITANHVTESTSLTLTDGRSFLLVSGSDTTLQNPSTIAGTPDLRMVRLADDPGLPALDIATTTPAASSLVMMMGAGLDRGTNIVGWTRNQFGTYAPAPIPNASQIGYNLQSTSHMRWGFNRVEPGGLTTTSSTQTFHTKFDRGALPAEAQAASGDSGGGVFQLNGGVWQLTGIMDSTQNFFSPGSNISVYGDQTYIADLATYRSQIETILSHPDASWQDQRNYYDVNGSGGLEPIDALLIINALKRVGPHTLTGTPGPNDHFLDANGDGQLSAADASFVLNKLINAPPKAASLAQGTNFVPEPATEWLATIGAATAMLAHGARRFRRRQTAAD